MNQITVMQPDCFYYFILNLDFFLKINALLLQVDIGQPFCKAKFMEFGEKILLNFLVRQTPNIFKGEFNNEIFKSNCSSYNVSAVHQQMKTIMFYSLLQICSGCFYVYIKKFVI